MLHAGHCNYEVAPLLRYDLIELAFVRYTTTTFIAVTVATAGMLELITEKLQNQKLDDDDTGHGPVGVVAPKNFNFAENLGKASSKGSRKTWAASTIPRERERVKGRAYVSEKMGMTKKKGNAGGQSMVPGLNHGGQELPVGHIPGGQAMPPKKKHCQSLLGPNSAGHLKWQPKATHIWKPIMLVRPGDNIAFNREFSPDVLSEFAVGGVTACSGLHDTIPPSESPVMRPASASSGFCDGSLSSLGAPWLEQLPPFCNKFDAFQNRSLSLEDEISAGSEAGSTSSVPSAVHCSSPHAPTIPRCRSQPCVLHARRYGLKRRREYERPALDFHKMTEIANSDKLSQAAHLTFKDYEHQRHHRPSSRPFRFRDEFDSGMSLMPIASSPLDTDIPRLVESPPGTMHPCQPTALRSYPMKSSDTGNPMKSSDTDAQDWNFPTTTSVSLRLDWDEARTSDPIQAGDMDDSGCTCQGDEADIFPITDLDIDQIEKH